jgi:hypothetical protein
MGENRWLKNFGIAVKIFGVMSIIRVFVSLLYLVFPMMVFGGSTIYVIFTILTWSTRIIDISIFLSSILMILAIYNLKGLQNSQNNRIILFLTIVIVFQALNIVGSYTISLIIQKLDAYYIQDMMRVYGLFSLLSLGEDIFQLLTWLAIRNDLKLPAIDNMEKNKSVNLINIGFIILIASDFLYLIYAFAYDIYRFISGISFLGDLLELYYEFYGFLYYLLEIAIGIILAIGYLKFGTKLMQIARFGQYPQIGYDAVNKTHLATRGPNLDGKYCTNCGTQVKKDARFCPVCGMEFI